MSLDLSFLGDLPQEYVGIHSVVVARKGERLYSFSLDPLSLLKIQPILRSTFEQRGYEVLLEAYCVNSRFLKRVDGWLQELPKRQTGQVLPPPS